MLYGQFLEKILWAPVVATLIAVAPKGAIEACKFVRGGTGKYIAAKNRDSPYG